MGLTEDLNRLGVDGAISKRFVRAVHERTTAELLGTLRALVAAIERADNTRDEGLGETSPEMKEARRVIAKYEGTT